MNKMKSHIDEKLSDITMNNELRESILNKTSESQNNKIRRFSAKKAMCLIAAVVLVLSTATTVFGAVSPAVNNMIYSVNSQFAEFLYPINKTCENQGIKLTVLEAVNDDRNIIAYFTLEDTQGKGRVNEKLDLCDSYGVNGPTVFNVSFESYDEKTGKALYCMTANGSKKMSGKMNRFTLNKIMSNKKIYNWYNTEFDLSQALQNPETASMSDYESYSNDYFDTVLLPDVMDIAIQDFVSVDNIGFIDGKLHIQTKWKKSFDNHGWFALYEKGKEFNEENIVPYMMQYIHTDEDRQQSNNDYFVKHIEYVFDITPGELDKYDLWAELYEDGDFTQDKWQVDFRLAQSDKLELTEHLDGIADKVEISNIGVYVNSYQGDNENCAVSIVMKDGLSYDVSSFMVNNSENFTNTKWTLSTALDSYIDINEISTVTIDGRIIYDK